MEQLSKWIMENSQIHLPILIAIIGLCGIIIGGLFTVVIWPLFKSALEQILDKAITIISGKDFENRYLDWVIQEHRYLPILPTTLVPVTEGKVHELEKLYVSLAVTEDVQRTKEISLNQAIEDQRLLVILGDPGAGKTTMLRFLALTFAKARRKRPSLNQAAEWKSFQNARKRVRQDFHYNNYPLPVFVYLNRLQNVTEWARGSSLLEVLRDEWRSVDILRDFPPKFLEQKLQKGQCVFLFDAFDELGTPEARDAIANYIGRLAGSAPVGNRFIVTSRIVGYSGQLGGYGFHVLTVQRLSWELIKQLVKQWYVALDESSLADQLLNTLEQNPRIYELAINPMLLSLIVLVQYVRRLIPDRRHVLYDECVKILVERRYAPPHVQERYNQILPSDEAMRLLREIGFAMHTKGHREVPRNELEQSLIPKALEKMPTSQAITKSPVDLLRNIEQRSELLVERGLNEKDNQ